jgi:hypothetical protein
MTALSAVLGSAEDQNISLRLALAVALPPYGLGKLPTVRRHLVALAGYGVALCLTSRIFVHHGRLPLLALRGHPTRRRWYGLDGSGSLPSLVLK